MQRCKSAEETLRQCPKMITEYFSAAASTRTPQPNTMGTSVMNVLGPHMCSGTYWRRARRTKCLSRRSWQGHLEPHRLGSVTMLSKHSHGCLICYVIREPTSWKMSLSEVKVRTSNLSSASPGSMRVSRISESCTSDSGLGNSLTFQDTLMHACSCNRIILRA